jgi:hypothetical protein
MPSNSLLKIMYEQVACILCTYQNIQSDILLVFGELQATTMYRPVIGMPRDTIGIKCHQLLCRSSPHASFNVFHHSTNIPIGVHAILEAGVVDHCDSVPRDLRQLDGCFGLQYCLCLAAITTSHDAPVIYCMHGLTPVTAPLRRHLHSLQRKSALVILPVILKRYQS